MASDLLSHARELERRDSAIARELDALRDVAERIRAIRARGREVRAALEALPGELEELTRRLGSAQAHANAAKETLAAAEERVAALTRARRSKQDDLDRAEREATTARQLLVDAESEVARIREQIDELRASEPELRKDAGALVRDAEGLGGELARLPRISEAEDLRPGGSLEELEQWGLLARSVLLVSRGTLEAERERVVVEANELAALVLGDSSAGSSVTLVRRRLEEAV
jgi:chromosome segregation ATPase